MNLKPVKSISQRPYHRLRDLIDEFVSGDADIVKVEIGIKEYKSPKVARSCLNNAIKKSKHHNVKVWLRGNQIFLSKETN